jgi:phosphoglycolate phosphatase-like HAD superfamily hydrolase
MAIYLKAYYSISEAHTKLVPNVASTLKILAERSKLALVTMRHCPNQVIYKELDYLGVAKYFKQIVTAMDTPQPKPSPQVLQCEILTQPKRLRHSRRLVNDGEQEK